MRTGNPRDAQLADCSNVVEPQRSRGLLYHRLRRCRVTISDEGMSLRAEASISLSGFSSPTVRKRNDGTSRACATAAQESRSGPVTPSIRAASIRWPWPDASQPEEWTIECWPWSDRRARATGSLASLGRPVASGPGLRCRPSHRRAVAPHAFRQATSPDAIASEH